MGRFFDNLTAMAARWPDMCLSDRLDTACSRNAKTWLIFYRLSLPTLASRLLYQSHLSIRLNLAAQVFEF